MPVTLADAQLMLDTWMEAERKLATGQSYSIGDRSLTRANLAEVGKRIRYWRDEVTKLTSGRTKPVVTRVIPRDN